MGVLRNSLEDFNIWLRNQLTDPANRPSNYTQTETTFGTTISFDKNRVKNVHYVKGDDNELTLRDKYTVNYEDQQIENLTGSYSTVDINYDYGSTWIYPESPRLTDVTMPRISFINISAPENPQTVGGSRILYPRTFQIDVWCDDDTTWDYGGKSNISGPKLREFLLDDIYDMIRNKRTWMPDVIDSRITALRMTKEEIGETEKGAEPARELWRGSVDVRIDYWKKEDS